MKQPSRSMKAFTLAEVLVVIAISGVVGIALNTMITMFYKDNAYLIQATTAIDSAHRGLRISFEDIREASYGDDGSYPLKSVATSTLTFFSDIDGDGSVEKIRLYLTNGVLYRGVADSAGNPPSYTGQPEATTTIATYVRNSTSTPLFTYYDTDGVNLGTTSIDISRVASISTSLMVDLNPLRAPDILILQETATLRNLR